MRIIFAGTPGFAAEHLRAVLATEHEVVAVYTQPDRPAGRGRKLAASPVKQLAMEHDIPVFQPTSLKPESEHQQLAGLNADLMVVVAYGLILPKAVLDIPKHGCINVHASLLPRWRGAAPIQRAIIAGDSRTGVTIMQMDVGLDTGDMLLKAECVIEPVDTGESLHDKLISIGQPCLQQALNDIASNRINPVHQDDTLACYAEKLSKDEGKIDWHLPAAQLDRLIRGFNPWPVAHTKLDDQVIRIWQAGYEQGDSGQAPGHITEIGKDFIKVQCGQGQLVLNIMQLPGSKAMPVAQILNGKREWFEQHRTFQL
ncbi:methionyl-tRNA formyltransferase [Gynuella sp.]|uniref:methionyl-tRNA formyltransferase n=1 Tax=Gynuella sp. TaxID=2969146 RepID=UPI003D0D4589